MKRDHYFPHEINLRNDKEVIKLIECEGASGYGIYWALMEYLRTQDEYLGNMLAMKTIARQMRTKPHKVETVLKNYGLFIITGDTFRSAKMESVMKALDDKRKKMEARKARTAEVMPVQRATTAQEVEEQCTSTAEAVTEQKIDNSLIINNSSYKKTPIVKERKVKKSKEYTSSKSSSTAAEAEVAAETLPASYLPAWERYVDDLQQDEQWKELMAMRTGFKLQFYTLFPRIVESFKRHVRMLGNEGRILSPSDAKHYFCFFLDPGSTTFKRLLDELQKPIDKGDFKYEDRDPTTGQRSYCGIQIPADAPPRPNAQAVWNEEKQIWIY